MKVFVQHLQPALLMERDEQTCACRMQFNQSTGYSATITAISKHICLLHVALHNDESQLGISTYIPTESNPC